MSMSRATSLMRERCTTTCLRAVPAGTWKSLRVSIYGRGFGGGWEMRLYAVHGTEHGFTIAGKNP